LVRTVQDPRLHPILGSAEHIRELLDAAGCHERPDAIVSSLGLSLIDPAVRHRILSSIASSLAPDGVYVQFGYFHTRYLVYSTQRGFVPFDYRGYLRDRFADVRRQPITLNFPPAWVYQNRRPYPQPR